MHMNMNGHKTMCAERSWIECFRWNILVPCTTPIHLLYNSALEQLQLPFKRKKRFSTTFSVLIWKNGLTWQVTIVVKFSLSVMHFVVLGGWHFALAYFSHSRNLRWVAIHCVREQNFFFLGSCLITYLAVAREEHGAPRFQLYAAHNDFSQSVMQKGYKM